MTKTPLRLNLESLKERKDWKRHQINQGENVYRILPPFGENSDGYPYRRWVVAWLSDPQTGRRRPYASPRSFGEDACPVTEYISLLEKKREELENLYKQKGASKEELREALKPISDVIWTTKPKAVYVYNASNKSGEVGLLELKKTAHDAMKKQMMQYVTDYGQDPTSLSSDKDDSGIWFRILREGEGTNTEYSVYKNQAKKKTAEGIAWLDDRDPLSQNISDNYDNLGYDLTTLYKRHSYDELKLALMANLAQIYAACPSAKVPGFEIEDARPLSVVQEAKPATPKKPIATRFDDEDDEEAAPVRATKPVKAAVVEEDDLPWASAPKKPAPAKSAKPSSDDEIFAYAESLLDN